MRIVSKSVLLALVAGLAAWAADNNPRMTTTKIVYQATLRNGFTVEYDHEQKVGDTRRLFLSADADGGFLDVPTEEIVSVDRQEIVVPLPAPAASTPAVAVDPRNIDQLVHSASDQHLVDPDLIKSVIKAESNFNARAVSPKGAQGLMQLMPQTANQLGVKDAFAPQENIDGGTRYLRDLLVLYNNDMAKALAAYNAGPHRVDQYHGVPPYRETHAYVAKVIKDFNRTKREQRAAAQGKDVKGPSSSKQPSSPGSKARTEHSPAKQPQAKSARSTPPVTSSASTDVR